MKAKTESAAGNVSRATPYFRYLLESIKQKGYIGKEYILQYNLPEVFPNSK